jgi:hypothetical protein
MTTINGVTVAKPTDKEITAWWRWAVSFSRNNSPFEKGWGNADDRNDQRQPPTVSVFCISCTAGQGGEDNESRPLAAAKRSRRDILVPVIVAYGESESVAKKQLGKPKVHFMINGNPREAYYKETKVGSVNFAVDNSFEDDPGTKTIYSAGYWAKISPSKHLDSIHFGGMGGQINPKDQREFQTFVTYGS